jgi:phosphoglycerate kinase
MDIGTNKNEMVKELLNTAHTIVWNGPLGAFEIPPFDQGTTALAQEIAAFTENEKLTSIAGGGDTLAALEKAGVTSRFTYVSTAGGAFLEWLEGKTLPGVAAITQRSKAA